MRIFVVSVLAAVALTLAESRIVSKCDLKRQLEEIRFNISEKAREKGLANEDYIAKSEYLLLEVRASKPPKHQSQVL